MIWCTKYEGRRFPFASLQELKEAIKNKWKEVTVQIVRKCIAQLKNDWMRLKQNESAIQHIFR